MSLSIGLTIAVSAITSRALGQGDREQAKRLAGASLVLMSASVALGSLLLYPFLGSLLKALGASGVTAELALRFCNWVLPSMPLLGAGMCISALLRALGDGKRAMYVTLSAALAVAVLDPLFIFGFRSKRSVQQLRLCAVFHRAELGPGHAGGGALHLAGRPLLRHERRVGWVWVRGCAVWRGGCVGMLQGPKTASKTACLKKVTCYINSS